METIPLFAAVVLAVHVSDTHGALTVRGAYLYFWARVVYLFLHAAGIPLIRSLVWNVANVRYLSVRRSPALEIDLYVRRPAVS